MSWPQQSTKSEDTSKVWRCCHFLKELTTLTMRNGRSEKVMERMWIQFWKTTLRPLCPNGLIRFGIQYFTHQYEEMYFQHSHCSLYRLMRCWLKILQKKLRRGTTQVPWQKFNFGRPNVKILSLCMIRYQVTYGIFSSECNHPNLLFQMKLNTTKKMASILNITDSAYYPSFKYGKKMHAFPFIYSYELYFRSMFRNVLSALNEALDITLHLHPLIEHFQVETICYL